MKIIQFVHPMFLTALGLHASLMFVPVGGDSEPELLEKDVPIAELTADASKAASSSTANKLPVPDLNVGTGAAKPNLASPKTANPSAIVQAKPAARSVPVKAATRAGSAAPAAQTAVAGIVAASGAGTNDAGASGASGTSGSSVGDAIRNAANGNSGGGGSESTSSESGELTTDVVNSPPEQQTSFIPDLSAQETDDSDSSTGNTAAGEDGAINVANNAKLTALIAALPRETVVPSSLEASVLTLQEALIYRPEGTKDEMAEQLREAWINAVSRQASSADTVERIEPVVVSSSTNIQGGNVQSNTVRNNFVLAYPMDSSVLREGRSLDVCLDEKPSNAEIGLVFNSQGELEIDPQILRSTGYEALNLELIAMLKDTENFPSDRNAKAYIYEIEIDYDAQKCVNLSELQS